MTERTFTEKARRDQIVEATIAVLATEGYRSASIARIAAEVGVSKALVLYHFASKRELMRETLFQVYRSAGAEVVGGLNFAAPPPEVLATLVRTSIRQGLATTLRRRAAEQIILNRAADQDGSGITFADRDPLYAGFEHLFRAGQGTGHFRPFDVRVMAVTYQGAIDGAYLYLDSHPDTDVDAFIESLVDLLLAAVSVHA